MNTPASTAYDDLAYPSLAFPQTHPDLLGSLATLFGLSPAPTDRCRVLELGCASGSNLMPLAYAWPDSQFLGIDNSARQIEHGQSRLTQVRLPNLELRHASILDIDETWGQFDYILCHGVYSWVPAEVQEGILRVCKRNLAPDGVAYISYNVLPGWHMRGMIREMMCYHDTWHLNSPPLDRVRQARGLLQFLSSACKTQQTPYALLLKQELEVLGKVADGYIFHEHLEEHNDPIYFFEFHERLASQGLRFLGEADFRMMVHENLPPEVREGLGKVAHNLIQMEQYLDFLSNRMFRQSLVCHDSHRPTYNLTPERIAGFRIASLLKPAPDASVDLTPKVQVKFVTPGGAGISSPEPIAKAGLAILAEAWPMAIPFAELFDRARARLVNASSDPAAVEHDRNELAGMLLKLYSVGGTGMVEFWRCYPTFAPRVSDKPVASEVARVMALDCPAVASLRHQCLLVNELDRMLIPMLDGTQTRTTVRLALMEAVSGGKVTLARKGHPVTADHEVRPMLTELIDSRLSRYAEIGLLIG